uniref:Mitochondrial folate transporter/carrier n=1 Tax=Syphacia muris TaxID=451379 RepID=A0A0N5B180_9BILA
MDSKRYEHLFGGFAGGVASTLVCHPLDLLKIRFSANEGSKYRPYYKSYWHATKCILRSGGIRSLYQGVVPNIVGASMSWGLYFQFYYAMKHQCTQQSITTGIEVCDNLLLGMVSGGCVLAITNPIWVVKTRLCLQYENEVVRRYKGLVHCICKMVQDEGFKALYNGFIPGLLGTTHGAVQFMLYNYMKEKKFKRLRVPMDQKLSTIDYLLYSAVSKILATTVTYPHQVLRTRLQDHHIKYNGILDVIMKTLTTEGIRGLYKGLLIANVRQLPAAIITFVTYENVYHFIKNLPI